MKELHLFHLPALAEGQTALPDDEAAHAVRVLRMRAGDTLYATDGQGAFYETRLVAASAKACRVEIVEKTAQPPLWRGAIRIAVAPTKNMDRTEWLAEKGTEIGCDAFYFLNCRNSERRVLKTERIERIVVSAVKQSHKARKPEVGEMEAFGQFVARPFAGQKFIAHCHEAGGDTRPLLKDVVSDAEDTLVLIGPEGDFTPDEVAAAEAAGFRSVSLGRSRLRTETAALAAIHTMYLAKAL